MSLAVIRLVLLCVNVPLPRYLAHKRCGRWAAKVATRKFLPNEVLAMIRNFIAIEDEDDEDLDDESSENEEDESASDVASGE